MSYSKPWIHKAASRSLRLLRSPIQPFLIEISFVTHTVSSSISKAYPGLGKSQSHALDVTQIRSMPSKCAEREKHLPLHILFPSFHTPLLLLTTFMKTKNTSRIRKNTSPLPHPQLQLQTRSQHEVTPISQLPSVNSLPGQCFYLNQTIFTFAALLG